MRPRPGDRGLAAAALGQQGAFLHISSDMLHPHSRILQAAASKYTPGELAGNIAALFIVIIASGLAAGLTLGLFSLDKMELEVLKISGSPREVRRGGGQC